MTVHGPKVGNWTTSVILKKYTDGDTIEITLLKGVTSAKWWSCAIKGDPEIDTEKIEGSQYIDRSLIDKLKERERLEEEEAMKNGGKTTDSNVNPSMEEN